MPNLKAGIATNLIIILIVTDKAFDEIRAKLAPLKIRIVHDLKVKGDRGLQRLEVEFSQCPFHDADRSLPGEVEGDELCHE